MSSAPDEILLDASLVESALGVADLAARRSRPHTMRLEDGPMCEPSRSMAAESNPSGYPDVLDAHSNDIPAPQAYRRGATLTLGQQVQLFIISLGSQVTSLPLPTTLSVNSRPVPFERRLAV